MRAQVCVRVRSGLRHGTVGPALRARPLRRVGGRPEARGGRLFAHLPGTAAALLAPAPGLHGTVRFGQGTLAETVRPAASSPPEPAIRADRKRVPMKKDGGRRRQWHASPLGELVTGALTAVCRKRGFASATLAVHWPDIVGARTAAHTEPDRMIWPRREKSSDRSDGGATLVIRADAAVAVVLQHDAPRLIERVNAAFGWPVVERIKFTQVHRRTPRPAPPAPPAAATDADRAHALAALAPHAAANAAAAAAASDAGAGAGALDASSDRLAAALVRLGANIHARRRTLAAAD